MAAKLEIDLKPKIRKLEAITKDLVTSSFVGDYKSAFKGRGLEFDGYREYTPTDDASLIDWKASIRSGKILIREFEEERNLNVFFLLDSSESMVFGSINKLKNEYSAELVASLSYAMLQAGDGVGLAMYQNKIVEKVPPKTGARQYQAILRALVNEKNYGGESDLAKALKFLNALIERGSLAIIVSDFLRVHGNWLQYLKVASKKYDLIGLMIRDPRDCTLPQGVGQVALRDPFSNKQVLVDVDKIRDSYEKYMKKQELEIKDAFTKSGADFLKLTTNQNFTEPIITFFKKRAANKARK